MKIKLLTRDGGFVHQAEIPPFAPPPEVIGWGSRIFVRRDESESDRERVITVVYREGLAYVLTEG